MREILYGIMIVVMLALGLVCGPFMDAGGAHAATMQMPDCQMAMDKAADKGKSLHDSTMMFKDCAKVDLFGTDYTVLKKPDLKITKIFYDSTVIVADYSYEPSASYHIRGPPPLRTADIPAHSPIYLTTQRLRI